MQFVEGDISLPRFGMSLELRCLLGRDFNRLFCCSLPSGLIPFYSLSGFLLFRDAHCSRNRFFSSTLCFSFTWSSFLWALSPYAGLQLFEKCIDRGGNSLQFALELFSLRLKRGKLRF